MFICINYTGTLRALRPSGTHIPNLLTNYQMKLHEIKTMCTTISHEHMSNFRRIIII